MEQAYVHFKQSIFQGKINNKTGNLEGEEKLPHRGHSVEAYIPIPNEVLPPVALTYFDLAKQKGFVGQGSPILYVTANDTKELKGGGVDETHDLVAEWPAIHGHLQKRINNKGLVSLRLCYFTNPVNYEVFEAFKESCRIRDMTLDCTYNSLDLFKVIRNADWNARIGLFVKRMSHDSALPVGFLEAISKCPELLGGMIKNPQRRTPLCEEASIEYIFDNNLVLADSQASGNLYPTGMYGGVSSPDMFDESKAPIRQPRAWVILKEEDALRAESGIQGYNEVVNTYFGGKIPLQPTLQGKGLESTVQEILPQIIDFLVDFVEN
ncbi:MAG: hypothetical protein Q8N63_07955 [Nanoarchaeota archaeon]|nr:hypothetical protein [Nanoarchaeota archaeon]